MIGPVALAPGVGAWFTGRAAGNLSHRRPHVPGRLAHARAAVAAAVGLRTEVVHLMHQVHGAEVGVVDATTPPGSELRAVDALVTAEPGRALAVQVADCVPLLLAAPDGPVAAVHVGRQGLQCGVLDVALDALADLGAAAERLRAAIGPAIGGCCYEVPATLRDEVAADHPEAASMTARGTLSLDLPAAVSAALDKAGVTVAVPWLGCTCCDPAGRWFSHRADPRAGRQWGLVVRWPAQRPQPQLPMSGRAGVGRQERRQGWPPTGATGAPR